MPSPFFVLLTCGERSHETTAKVSLALTATSARMVQGSS